MKKGFRKITKLALMVAILFATVSSVSAYNTKFSFDLTSGWLSLYSYSSYATKYTKSENPVVKCTYVSGSTSNFIYTVRNSNNADRVTPFLEAGTFATRAFKGNNTVQNYMYRLGIRREGGSWNSSANAQGQWNIDSY